VESTIIISSRYTTHFPRIRKSLNHGHHKYYLNNTLYSKLIVFNNFFIFRNKNLLTINFKMNEWTKLKGEDELIEIVNVLVLFREYFWVVFARNLTGDC
jgi:hypothetical protein